MRRELVSGSAALGGQFGDPAASSPVTVSVVGAVDVAVRVRAAASRAITSERCGVRSAHAVAGAAASSSAMLVSAISRPRPMTTRWSAVSSQLAHQVAGDEHGAALGGERPQQAADPADALRVEAVDRLVEHQHRRVAEQRRRRCRAAGACRARSRRRAAARRRRGRRARAPRRRGGAGRPLLCASQSRWLRRAPPGMDRAGVEQRADLAERRRAAPRSAARRRAPCPRSGRSSPRIMRIVVDLPAPFGPDEAGDRPGVDRERRVRRRRRCARSASSGRVPRSLRPCR